MEKKTTDYYAYTFYNKERTVKLDIDLDFLIVHYNTYTEVEDLKKNVDLVIDLISKVSDIPVRRTGLRYVNVFENNDLNKIEWSKYINKSALIKDNFAGREVLQHMNTVNLRLKDEALVRVQYGLFNGEMPNDRIKDAYVIDIDVYTGEALTLEKAGTKISEWNEIINDIFESFITDRMRDYLNGKIRKL